MGLEGEDGFNYSAIDSCGIGDRNWNVGAPGCTYRHDTSEFVLHQISVFTCNGSINSSNRSTSPRVCACEIER